MPNGNTTPTKKHFVDYDNATAVLTPYANEIRKQQPIPITYEEYLQLTVADINSHRYVITDYPDTGYTGNSALSSLIDVDTTGVIDGKVLGYDATSGKWKPITAAADQIQADYTQTDNTKADYIKNKPTLGAAAAKGTTNIVDNSTNLVESGAVQTAINNAISNVYKPAGSKTTAELVAGLLIADNLDKVYNMSTSGTTTSDFVEGQGKTINIGDNVAIVDIGISGSPSYKFDLLAGFVDLSSYQTKNLSSAIVIEGTSYTTVEDALNALNTNKVSGDGTLQFNLEIEE